MGLIINEHSELPVVGTVVRFVLEEGGAFQVQNEAMCPAETQQ